MTILFIFFLFTKQKQKFLASLFFALFWASIIYALIHALLPCFYESSPVIHEKINNQIVYNADIIAIGVEDNELKTICIEKPIYEIVLSGVVHSTEARMCRYVVVLGTIISFAVAFFYFFKNNQMLSCGLKTSERILFIDILKSLCALIVVILHGTVSFFDYADVTHGLDWLSAVTINSITTCGVPIFFMMSGALLIGKEFNFKKLLERVIGLYISLLLWSLVYIIYRSFSGESIDIKKQLIWSIFKEQYYHLWFMYTIVGISVAMPIISMIYGLFQKETEIFKRYFVTILIVVPIVVRTLFSLIGVPQPQMWFALGMPEMALLLCSKMIMDYHCNNVCRTRERLYWAIGAILSLSVIIAGTYWFSVTGPNKILFSYGVAPVFFYALCVFALFSSSRNIFEKMRQNIKKYFYKISDVSIGVFFLHMLVMNICKDVTPQLFSDIPRSLITSTGVFLITVMICVMGAYWPGIIGKSFGRRN